MTELDHEVVKRLCDHNATTVEIYKQLNNGHSIAPWFSFHQRIYKEKNTLKKQHFFVNSGIMGGIKIFQLKDLINSFGR